MSAAYLVEEEVEDRSELVRMHWKESGTAKGQMKQLKDVRLRLVQSNVVSLPIVKF